MNKQVVMPTWIYISNLIVVFIIALSVFVLTFGNEINSNYGIIEQLYYMTILFAGSGLIISQYNTYKQEVKE